MSEPNFSIVQATYPGLDTETGDREGGLVWLPTGDRDCRLSPNPEPDAESRTGRSIEARSDADWPPMGRDVDRGCRVDTKNRTNVRTYITIFLNLACDFLRA